MPIAYFDAFSGISGDMTVGALLALGVPLECLRDELRSIDIGGYEISARRVHVNGIEATKFSVIVDREHPDHHHHRPFSSVRAMLNSSGLKPAVKAKALAIFTRLAEAEGRVHGVSPDDVEFHELGAVDSIVDVVGTAFGFVELGVSSAYVSPLPLGFGVVTSQHGPLPVPAPATVELLRGFTLRPDDDQGEAGELVTPTGAAIVATLAEPSVPAFRIEAVGYGAGTRRLRRRANVLRLMLGESSPVVEGDEIVHVAANIDDANPELYDYVVERLLAAGARDVYLTPVHMKKNRPGIVLNALCADADRQRIAAVILTETTAIGLRYHALHRSILPRRRVEVATEFGPVTVKVAEGPDGRENVAPEYEDCRRLAREKQVPLKIVYQAALTAYLRR